MLKIHKNLVINIEQILKEQERLGKDLEECDRLPSGQDYRNLLEDLKDCFQEFEQARRKYNIDRLSKKKYNNYR